MNPSTNKKRKDSQVTLEVTAAFLMVFLLLAASARLFVWFSNNLAGRQEAFSGTREIKGSGPVSPGDVQGTGYDASEELELDLLGGDWR